jgi:hypothetical protein
MTVVLDFVMAEAGLPIIGLFKRVTILLGPGLTSFAVKTTGMMIVFKLRQIKTAPSGAVFVQYY